MGGIQSTLENIVSYHDRYIAKANRKGSKNIDMIVYLGESLDYYNYSKKNWDKRFVKALNKVDKNFYKTFDLNFNFEFRTWPDDQNLWPWYFKNYETLPKEDQDVFKIQDKSRIKDHIKEYENASFFTQYFLDLVIHQKIKDKDLEKGKIVMGVIKDVYVVGKGIDYSLTSGSAFSNHGEENNEYYTVLGLDWDIKSTRKITHLIQHEVSHLFGAKHKNWFSVMNCYSHSQRWDKKNKKIMRKRIKYF